MPDNITPPAEQSPTALPDTGWPSPSPDRDKPSSPTDLTVPVLTTEPDGDEGAATLLFPIVGIGGSAGSTQVYIEIVKSLPSNTGMAFVLVPHQHSESKSYLRDLLAPHTTVPVMEVQHNAVPEPDHVYVLPPGMRLKLEQGRFQLTPRQTSEKVFLPIDIFFRSLAFHQKGWAIGIVLSGLDSDGALGLQAIKGEGGIAIVQEPESARYESMPRNSLAADGIDLVLQPAQMAEELARLGGQFLRHQSELTVQQAEPPAEDGRHLPKILSLLRSVSGLDFRHYKPTTLRRRIARRMMLKRVDSLQEYARLLAANPLEVRDLQEDILIHVTRFFRDPEVFDAFKSELLPRLFQDRPPESQLRVWIAGCASGEEAYSFAMCILEYLSGHTLEPSIQIFGTDASEHAIEKARQAIYPETIVSDVSAERIRRFFVKVNQGYQISKRVRDLCIFARQNLCNDPPFSRLDVVSCRNVLIYLNPDVQRTIISTLHYSLKRDSYLILGSSETIREHVDLFVPTDRRNKLYAKAATGANTRDLDFYTRLQIPALDGTSPVVSAPRHEGWSELDLQRAADRIILARYSPAGVVINAEMEVLQSRGQTAPFLQMPPGTASLNLLRMAREGLAAPLRDAVQRAIQQDVPTQTELVRLPEGNRTLEVTAQVLPIHSVSARGRCYLVLFVARSENLYAEAPHWPQLPQTQEHKDREIIQLRQDLTSNKQYLQSLIEEREAKNQELISANEEIQSTNEELQSINEELETAKEELQSANEELQTVNEELQTRNAELSRSGNDLTNLLNSVNIPVLMLDSALRIRHFTPLSQRLLNVRPTDVGRPLREIRLNLNLDDLEPILQEVLDTLGTRELEVQDWQQRWHLLRVRPYRTLDNRIEGVVMMLLDIDELHRSQLATAGARNFANAVIESIETPLAVLNTDLRIRMTNKAFQQLSGQSAADLERRSFPELIAMVWNMSSLRQPLEALGRDNAGIERFESEQETAPNALVDGSSTEGSITGKTLRILGRSLGVDGERIVLVSMEDVTARRQAERMLQSEHAALAGQVESTVQALGRTQDELHALAASLITAQDEERRRIARELHDDLAQRLALVEIELQQLLYTLPPGAQGKVLELQHHISELSEEARHIAHRLHPSALEDLGLDTVLCTLVEEFAEREHMIATFYAENLPEQVSREVAASLYRITQEALRNVAKHAGRTHVKVTLTGVDHNLRLTIRDFGEGFDLASRRGRSLGLVSMEERAKLIQGSFFIQSALGEGTIITVHVPLPREVK